MTTAHAFRLVLMTAAISVCGAALAAEPEKPKAGSLDEQLGKGLDDELGDLLLPELEKPEKPEKADRPKSNPTDEALRDELQPGEDVELGPPEHPVARVGKLMRESESLLAKKELGPETDRVQQQIVRDLEKLLEAARKRAQSQGGGGQQSRANQGGTRSTVKQPRQPGATPRASNRPADESTDRLGTAKMSPVDMAEMREVMKDVWGQLPEHERELMRQAGVEEFLPKYELLIEKYFRRLAEGDRELP